MKNSLKSVVLLGGCALLLFLAGLWLRSNDLAPEGGQATPPLQNAPQSLRVDASGQAAPGLQSAPKPLPAGQPPSSVLRKDASEFERFNDWAARYEAATEEQRRGLVDEGLKIAQVRRVALQQLIETNPRRAIENAVPPVLRQKLPPEVVARLEERVNEEAFYGVLGAVPSAEHPKTPAYRREVRTSDGGHYRAYVYGQRLSQPTTEKASIVGIAVDDVMAIDERPLRVVARGEIPNHPNNLTRRRTVTLTNEPGFTNGRELRTSPAPPHDIVETCPISGETTEATKTETDGSVSAADIVVEARGKFHVLCRGGHIQVFEDGLLEREGGNGGPVLPTSPPSATQSTGYKTHLLMRVAFPEALKGSVTEKEGHDLGKNVQDWFIENSYGAMTFLTTVTPLIRLPRSEAWYKDQDTSGSAYEVLSDARAAAKAAGFDPANFNFDTVIYTGSPGSFGGQAYVGGKGCWLKSGTGVGVACHEYGHNFGLWHANFWTTTNGSTIGGGSHSEYGDSFDTMGSANAGDYHFNACHKNLLNWIPTSLVHDVTTSGTYRIYQMDQPAQNPRLRYAIKTRKDADRDYWIDLRQKFASNAWVQGGVFLHWSPWVLSEGGAHLLDTTPGSIDAKNDAPIVIGRTFSDLETGIHITPIAKNATTPPSADVVVNLGMFPGNSAPVAAVSASATSVATNVAVDFTATASDLDGDVLSYAWDFGDKSFSTSNSPTVSKSWSAAGDYRVRCTVSDMKGKTASASLIVTVGSPGTFRIAGTVTAGGQPLANVRVHNSKTGTSYREAYTDADGTYTLTRLAAGTYTVASQFYGYTLTPTGSASVTVGPDKTGMNFTAADQPIVSIAVQDADCAEGANTGSFRISRTGSTAAALTVTIHTPQGSASKGTDYTQLPTFTFVSPFDTLTIPAGSSHVDVVVTATDDSSVESYESSILTLAPSTSYVIGNAAATLWIADTDTQNSLVRLSVADRDADESGDAGQFVIERLGSTASALNVSVALSGTATNGTDCASIPTTVTIPAGASSVPVNVTPLQDSTVETMETVTLTISTNAAYTRPASSADYAGTVNLHDDDQPVLTVVATDSAAAEAGSDPGVFTVTRTGSTAAALTVNYGITGTALHGTDYVALPGVLTIPAGSSVGTVVVTPIDDSIGEPAQTVVLQLRGGIGYTVASASNATVTITDSSDVPYASIAVTTGPAIEGGTAGVFRVTTAGTGTGNITLGYTVTGTATNGTDFTSLIGTLSIGKNTTSNISIATIQDTTVEGYETVTLSLNPDPAYSLALDASATLNIQDDDAPQVNVSTTDDSFSEANGSLAKFFLSRTGSTAAALTVNYTLGGTATSGSDYTAPSGSVTIAAGSAGAFVDVSMLDDTLAEGTETIVFNVTPDAAYSTGISSATRYITDAESASLATQVRFAASSSSAAESAGTVNIPVTLNAAAASTVTVEYFLNGGNALAEGVDYTLTPGLLTFDPGETSKNIVVTLNDDTNDEGNETLVIALANHSNAKLGTSSHTLTITDSDTPPAATVGFAGTSGSGLESQSTAPLTVALSTAQAGAVTVDYAVTGGTATTGTDYAITAGTLTFAAGETVKTIPNTIVDDLDADSGETIVLTLSNPGGAAVNANAVFTYTITDDDAAIVTIVATDAIAAEPGSDTGLFTVSRTGATTAPLTVNFSVSGTATSGADYANLGNTVDIAAGASTATVLLTPVDDNVIDPAETVALTLTPGVYTIGAANSATVTIVDDEADTIVTIAASDPSAAEAGDPGAFTVTRVGSSSSDLTVTLGISGTAAADIDYTAFATSVVIPAASASAIIPVSPLLDALNEGDETVILTALAGSGYTRGSPASATVIIADSDDGSPPTLAPSSIVDDQGGGPVYIDTLVTYTVTFSKDMDASSVTASDFGNAGSAAVTIGSVTEISPTSGVFSVQATPTNAGTLQLRVNAAAVLKSHAGINLDTTSAIADDTIITAAGYPPTLADALDTSGLPWTNSGDASWFYQTSTTHDGVDAGQSGAVDHNQSSSIETTITGPGTLTFWWKVSSESAYDYLRFDLDGVEQTGPLAKISGNVDWVQKTVAISSGNHFVRWGYSKDGSVVSGSDAAWVDQVVYTPAAMPEIAVEQPVGTDLVDGNATIDGGSIGLGSSSAPITVTVRNSGTADLTGLAITKDGSHSADFTLGSLGATTLAPGASTTFTVTFSPSAAGVRNAALHIASNDANENPFDISLTGTGIPQGTLAVTPTGAFRPSGSYGGPFNPGSQEFTLSNIGSTPIDWTAGKTVAWLDLSVTSGTLAAGANTTVTVSINANANSLQTGSYSDTVNFNNTTNTNGNTTREVSLTVNPIPATFNFSDLLQTYNGSPRPATVATTPPGLAHTVTYNGSATAPTIGGTYNVVATITQPNYSGSGSASLTIDKAPQGITFDELAPVTDAQTTFALTATASSGLTVSYTSSNPAVATVSGSTVTIVGLGSTDITATQAGNTNYQAAAPVVQTLNVVRANPLAVITGAPFKLSLSQALSLNGSASQPSYGESITTYEWDLNNDDTFGDVTGVTPAAISFATLNSTWGMVEGLNPIKLKVTDSANKTSIVSTTVTLVFTLTWDANGTTSGQTNGAGAWLNADRWWNGGANQTWAAGSNAIFGGPSTAGGAVTLASPTSVNLMTFNTFTGTYTLGTAGQALTITGGINQTSTSAAVSIISPINLGADQTWTNRSASALTTGSGTNLITNNGYQLTIEGTGNTTFGVVSGANATLSGAGSLIKNGTGRFSVGGLNSSFTGPVTINGGILHGYNNSGVLGTGNLALNGGVLSFYWTTTYTRTLGTGTNQVQIPGGNSGFAGSSTSGPTVNLGATVVWGASGEGSATGFFNPGKFVLGDAGTTNAAVTVFSSGINLNGANRVISVPYGLSGAGNNSTISGAISNSTGTAGLTLEGGGLLILSAANTYNGDTTISGGTLRIGNNTAGTLGSGNYAGRISIASGSNLQIWSSAAQTLSGVISGGGGLQKAYGGALTLSGANTYTGKTSFVPQSTAGFTVTVSSFNSVNGGTPLLASSSLGAPTTVANGTIDFGSGNVQAAVTLKYTGSGETTDRVVNFLFNGTGATKTLEASGSGLLKFTSTFTGSGSGSATNDIALAGTSNGEIVGGLPFGFRNLSKTGAGTWTLGGSSTHTGTTTITAGNLALGGNNVLPNATAVSIANATLDAATYADTLGTLDVTSTAKINLGAGATLVFADSSAVDWTGGTLNLTGTFVPGSSLRFGTGNTALTAIQLAKITASGFGPLFLDPDGYLTADTTPPTLVASAIVDDKGGAPVTVNTLVTYTVTFSEDLDATTVTAADFGNAGNATLSIGTVTETSPTSGVFTVQASPTSAGTLQLRVNAGAVLKDVSGNNLNTATVIVDDTTLSVDGTAPTVVSIADDQAGGPILVDALVTYTVSFSEDLDASTVTAADFGNAGSATLSIGTVTETSPTSGVFTVQASPTSAGTLQLRIHAGAVLKDVAGNNLNTAAAIVDDTTLSVDATAPTMVSIVDDKGGAPVTVDTLVTYTMSFSEDLDASTVTAADFSNAGSATLSIGTVTETSPTSGVFTVQASPTSAGTLQLRIHAGAVLKDVAGNNLNTATAIVDDTTLSVDATTPTMVSIVDDKGGAPVTVDTLVTYTVTFSEDLDASTVTAADFGNAGSATLSIGTVTETSPTSGVFTVQASPTSAGTLQLRINAGAVLKDVAGNNLNTATAIVDDTTLSVDGTAPTVVSVVDDQAGGPILLDTLVTYTVTFSEDLDASTVAAADFGNAGSATLSIGTVTETSPESGVFTVQATPTSAGTLQLRINAGAVLKDVAGNNLDTAAAIADDSMITVHTVYGAWSGGTAFNADENGDGVANGVAWLLGATDTAANVEELLPVLDDTRDADYTIYTYRRSDVANADAHTTISAEYTSNLEGVWTTVVHDGTNVIITVSNDFYGVDPGIDKVEVKIKRNHSASGPLFLRLKVTAPLF